MAVWLSRGGVSRYNGEMYYNVAVMAGRKGEGLTYFYEGELMIGQVVKVPVGKRELVGVVMENLGERVEASFQVKAVSEVIAQAVLPEYVVQAAKWLAEYYAVPLAVTMKMFLPTGVEKKRRVGAGVNLAGEAKMRLPLIELNDEQQAAVREILAAGKGTRLLHGVTGAGKTNVYLALTAEILRQGKSVIVLVPEISLTSQVERVFMESFGERVMVIHSKQTEAVRHQKWKEALELTTGVTPKIILGPRSALTLPVPNLGLIVVDEAHEPAYFQENSPRYSAVRLASKIAEVKGILTVLGTATPTAADYFLAEERGGVVKLLKRAKKLAREPEVTVVDMRERANFRRSRYFSEVLMRKIERNLKEGLQTLIFHNRRGSAPVTMCEECGWQAMCPTCFLPLTLHHDAYKLACHACGYTTAVQSFCPSCGQPEVLHKGFGTKMLEMELSKRFPEAKIARFDADTEKGKEMAARYDEVRKGEIEIIVGTQGLAKGFDLPRLATVGVVQADSGLMLPDFAASERTYQLLTQVMGRVGRGHVPTAEVVVQSYQPENFVIQAAVNGGYEEFYRELIKERKAGFLPPFAYLGIVEVVYKTEVAAVRNINELRAELARKAGELGVKVRISPAMPAFHERSARGYHWRVVLRARQRRELVRLLAELPEGKKYSVTIDPVTLL